MEKLLLSLYAVAAFTVGTQATAVAASHYSITDLGNLGGQSVASDLNNGGQVVGYSMLADGDEHAFLWQQSTGMVDLGTLPGDDNSGAFSINNAGQVTGFSQNLYGPTQSTIFQRGFLWASGDGMSDIGAGSGGFVAPTSINQQGQIVGSASVGGFIYSSTTGISQVKIPGINVGGIYALNDNGAMVVADPDNVNLLFSAPGQPIITIDAGPGLATNTGRVAMNEQGTVAGAFESATALPFHAYIWNATSGLTDLTPGANDSSWAFGINNLNEVVGEASLDGGPTFPFLYENGILTDLTASLDSSAANWTDLVANSINDNGQIAGYGTFDGQTEAFLLTPNGASGPGITVTPEPATLSLLALAAIPLLRRRRRGD